MKDGKLWEDLCDMSSVTSTQKKILIDFAAKYEPRLPPILNKGNDQEVIIETIAEAKALDDFSSRIVRLVGEDYPDEEGKDYDINQDAILTVSVIARLIGKFEKAHPN